MANPPAVSLTQDSSLPHPWLFLVVRRGLPLALATLCLEVALFVPWLRGWCLIAGIACLMEVWPTFLRGEAYLKRRRSLIRWDGYWTRALQPLARQLGMEEAWILSFCAWNNQRVSDYFTAHPARKALVLLPHCIQLTQCKLDVVSEPTRCKQCGRCPVGDCLPPLGSAEVRIANRSHKAYLEARAFQPDLVIAISCYTRLLKGLIKMPDAPSYVIPLERPYGMCVDTHFNVQHLRAALAALTVPPSVTVQSETQADNVVRLRHRA